MTATKGIPREQRAIQAHSLVGKLIQASKPDVWGAVSLVGVVTRVMDLEFSGTSPLLREQVFLELRKSTEQLVTVSVEQRIILFPDGSAFEYEEVGL